MNSPENREYSRSSPVPEFRAYYDKGTEIDRLFSGRSQLERVRTQELLQRHLPPPPAIVLDVGGGPGFYSHWLAGLGYETHLIDIVPLHVENALAKTRNGRGPRIASAQVGDARQLEWTAQSTDVVLLFGPLYHLTNRDDRLRALREARRVTRTGGLVCVVGVSRFSSLLDGLSHCLLDDPEFIRIVEADLATGQHRNRTNHPGYWTTAYLHHPDELRLELTDAGLVVEDILGIEGPGYWAVSDFSDWWNDPARHERLLAAARSVEREPTLLGMEPHIMAVARRT